MDKLKKSAVAKVVAAILLSVSLFMAAVSSCVVVAAISYGGSSQMQAEAIYDGYMGNLVDNSSYQVDEYYKAYVESQDDTQENQAQPLVAEDAEMAVLVQQTIQKMQQLNEQQFKGLELEWHRPEDDIGK